LKELPKEIVTYFKVFENINTFENEREIANIMITLFESAKLKSGQIV